MRPLPVKHAYIQGGAAALDRIGLKIAGTELRLKIPTRTFHGFDAAQKSVDKKADVESDAPGPQQGNGDSHELEQLLEQLTAPTSPNTQLSTRDHLDRSTSWGTPSNMAAGDAGSRSSDMGQTTGFGGV